MPARFADDRRSRTPASTSIRARSSALLELSARHEREGLGDAPWPPHYEKQAGEPARVQPSRRRTPTHPLIEIGRAREKEDALAGLERWKARHPEAAAHLEPADVLVDAMRGRFRTWTRIRVNLQHVPVELRPAQEPLDPDERPMTGPSWRPAGHATSRRRARAEDLLELVRRRDLELIVAAVGAAACRGASAGRPPRGGTALPCMWSYFTSHTRSMRSGSHDRSLPALQRLCPPGMRVDLAVLPSAHSRHG